MGRLTKKHNGINVIPLRNSRIPYWRIHITDNGIDRDLIGEAANKLADYEDAEEAGTLIKLPCKVGDYLYFETWIHNASENIGVQGHQIKRIDIDFVCDDERSPTNVHLWEIGENIFLTREEADAVR